MSYVTLSREVSRDSRLIEEVLLKCYNQTESKNEVIKAFFEADLMRELNSVQLGFQLY